MIFHLFFLVQLRFRSCWFSLFWPMKAMSYLLFQSLKPHANLPGTPGSDQAMTCSDSKPLFSLARLSKPLSFGVLLSFDVSSQQITNFDLKSLWNKATTKEVLSKEAKTGRDSSDHLLFR